MRTLKHFLTALTLLFVLGTCYAGVETATNENDVILAGHDAVAYFDAGKPVKGSSQYTAQFDGAVYLFSNTENRDKFKANPSQYAPAYGGYCAFGTSVGKKFHVDGKAFKVVEGRLYVNKDINVYNTWKKDIPGNIVKAEGQWPTIKPINPSDL